MSAKPYLSQSWLSFVARSQCVASADGQKDCLCCQRLFFLHTLTLCPNEAVIIVIVTAIAQGISHLNTLFALVALNNYSPLELNSCQ